MSKLGIWLGCVPETVWIQISNKEHQKPPENSKIEGATFYVKILTVKFKYLSQNGAGNRLRSNKKDWEPLETQNRGRHVLCQEFTATFFAKDLTAKFKSLIRMYAGPETVWVQIKKMRTPENRKIEGATFFAKDLPV